MGILRCRSIFLLSCMVLAYGGLASAQQAGEPQASSFKLQVNVVRVLVPVVVRDKQGRLVDDLKKEDFQVFDNGKPQPISAFTVQKRGEAESGLQPPAPSVVTPQPSPQPERTIVFLFDDLHLSGEEFAQAKAAAAKVVAAALSPSDISAVVTLSGKTNSGLTRDRAKLQEAIKNLQPRGLLSSENAACPHIGYYQADLMENHHDPAATADAIRQVFDCSPGLDPKYNYNAAQSLAESSARLVLNRGREDIQATFAAMAEYVHRMSTLPGQRTLVLVSPGFLPIEQEARTDESRILDLAAQSNVTISALDARGLHTTEANANEASPGFTTMLAGGGSLQLQQEYRITGSSLAEDAMGELAEGTGGTFFHGSNDFKTGFQALAEAPQLVYVLEIDLGNVKPDGSYHRLKVKVDRDGLQLQARRGYSLLKPISPTAELALSGDEIRVDLVVLDKKDRPVLDLKPEQIAVTDADSSVELNNFRLITGKDKSVHPVALLFDRPIASADPHQSVDLSAVNQTREVAERILKVFPEHDFSFSVLDVEGRLQLQHGFSTDRKALAQAIAAATQPAASESGEAANPAEQELMAEARTGNDAAGKPVGMNDLALARALFAALGNSSRIAQDEHLQHSMAALLALAQSLQPVAERKAILYFTSFGGGQADSRTMEAIDSIVGAANRAGVTIYVVDLNRLDRRAAQLEAAGMTMALPSDAAPVEAHATSGAAASQEAVNSVLQHLAEGTGGSYIVAEDDYLKPAKQMMEDLTTYYEASYLPDIDTYDGKFRPVAVKALRPGLTVRSQTGYFALPAGAGATLQPFELPLMKILGETQLPSDLNFRAAILHMEDGPEGSVNTLAIEAPLSSLDVREDASTNLYSAHVAIVAELKDKTGAVVAHFSEDIPRRGALKDNESSKFEAITMQRHFIAPAGSYSLEIAVLDRNSGKAGAQRVTFELPGAAAAPSLSAVVLVRKTEPFRAADDPSEPLQHGSDKVVPNLSGQLPPGARDFSMFFIAHPDAHAPEPAMLSVHVFRDGKPMEGAPVISQQARKAEFSSYLANLSIDQPKGGLYEVRVALTQGGKVAESRASFTLAGIRQPAQDKALASAAAPATQASTAAPELDLAQVPAAPASSLVITFPTNPMQPPAPEELKSLIEDARHFALDYSHSLPNFVCEQVTNRSVNPKGTGAWKHKDKFTELLTYVDQVEARTLLVKESGAGRSHKDTGDTAGAMSAGEFGGVLEGVFRPTSKTSFEWKQTGVLGDGTVQVFDYRVARENSILDIGAGTTVFVGCHGQVFIDSATRGVRRITMEADGIPENFPIRATSLSVDYDYVAINNHDYLLPVGAQIVVIHGHGSHEADLNQIEFRNFRRFGSKVRILKDSPAVKP